MEKPSRISLRNILTHAKLQLRSRQSLIVPLLAFFIPLLVRSVPEILSWPYPIGFDTIRYIPAIQEGWVLSLGMNGFLKDPNLFYVMAAFPYALTNDAVVVVKVLGPLLFGASCFMMYLYARKALDWSEWKSLLVAILASTYFVSLRNSWDFYRQTFGLIFLMATLISLKSHSSPRRYYIASAFMVLTVLSHELLAVIMFFIIGTEAVRYLVKKARKDFLLLFASSSVSGFFFLFQRFSHQATLPVYSIASEPSIGLYQYIIGLLLYMYILILPFVLIGLTRLKDSVMRFWVVLCMGILLLTMLLPNESLLYWNRWALLLVYPFLFFAVEGFGRLWRCWSTSKRSLTRLAPKVLVIASLFSLLTLSGVYLTTTPENAFPLFSQYNPYLMHIPSSMLQTSISINDSPSLVNCLQWLNENTSETSVIVSHYALYDWATIYVHNRQIVSTYEYGPILTQTQNVSTLAENMVDLARNASENGHEVYTVWWINGEGWYQLSSLPSDFREVYVAGRMAVYSYVPQV